jgi:hypothetical protein
MKERRREVEGKIFNHAEGLGTVTRQMIEDRAREIALIDGRTRPSKEDRLVARRELLHMRGIEDNAELVDEELDSLDPSDTPTHHGTHAPNFETDDEELVQRQLVEQGIEEAEHEQMLEGHFAAEEEEETFEEEERRREQG